MIHTLQEVCSHVVDCKNRTATEDPNGGYFAVGTPAMRGNVINYAEARRINESTFAEWTARLLPREGDILFAREAPVGPVVSIPAGGNVAAGQRTMLLRTDPEKADSDFLRLYLSAPITQARILALAHGSTTPHLRVADVRSFPVNLPTLNEQKAIAAVLCALEDKIAVNTKLAATASELAGVLYDASADRFRTRPMSEVLRPVLGGTPARSRADFWGGDQLWASAKDITGAKFGVLLSSEEKITEAAVAGTKARPLPGGSVILTARGTVGAVARLAAPTSFNQSCYGFVPGEVPPGVLYFAITRAVSRAKEIAHGSVFDTITMKTFDHLPFPDFDYEALTATEAQVAPLLESVVAVVRENSSLTATRDALLPQLMSGKLRVKDAEKVLENSGV